MTTPADDVQWFGWELHCTSSNSDKFYRFLVTLIPDPAVIGISGRSGAKGTVQLLQTADADGARGLISKAIQKTREKERKGYYLTRDFTPFTVSNPLSDPSDLKRNAHTLASLFGSAASKEGTESGTPAPVPKP